MTCTESFNIIIPETRGTWFHFQRYNVRYCKHQGGPALYQYKYAGGHASIIALGSAPSRILQLCLDDGLANGTASHDPQPATHPLCWPPSTTFPSQPHLRYPSLLAMLPKHAIYSPITTTRHPRVNTPTSAVHQFCIALHLLTLTLARNITS